MTSRKSVVQFGCYSRGRCGYCEGKDTSRRFGVWALSLSVEDYQVMIDAGWRRSGHYLYRPDIVGNCCPAYTIRLRASSFTPSTTHKRVLKRLRRHSRANEHSLTTRVDPGDNHGSRGKKHSRDSSEDVSQDSAPAFESQASASVENPSCAENPDTPLSIVQQSATERYESEHSLQSSSASQHRGTLRRDVLAAVVKALSELASAEPSTNSFSETVISAAIPSVSVILPRKVKTKSSKKKRRENNVVSGRRITDDQTGNGKHVSVPHFSSNAALVLAATERRFVLESGANTVNSSSISEPRDLAKSSYAARQMEIGHIVLKKLKEQCASDDPVLFNFGLASPGFINIWVNDEKRPQSPGADIGVTIAAKLSASTARPNEDKSRAHNTSSISTSSGAHCAANSNLADSLPPFRTGPFCMEIVPARFDNESFQIYRKYQTKVHRDELEDCDREAYTRFLVDSPLVRVPGKEVSNHGHGSFHILYRLNGRLFAVGVVDILPRCLSSVYLFYDPDFAILSPGVLSALKEIEWVQQESARNPELQFYYMGYYIHSCPKMRYKASYAPSEIMCPETRTWTPASVAIERLNIGGANVTRLAPDGVEPASDIGDYIITKEDALAEARSAILHLSRHKQLSLSVLQQSVGGAMEHGFRSMREEIAEFVKLVGRSQSRSFAFDISFLLH